MSKDRNYDAIFGYDLLESDSIGKEAVRMLKKLAPWAKEFFQRADMLLLALCLICSVFGLVVIGSATAHTKEGSAQYVLIQIIAMLIGVGLYVLITVIDIDVIADKWIILYAVSALLLLALIPFGYEDDTGNKSWLRFGPIGIQPSEVVKIIYIVVMAKHIAYLKEYHSLNHVLSVLQLAVHFLLPFAMVVVISSDLGSALIFLFIFIVLLFVAGLRFYWFILGAAAVAAAIPLLWTHVLRDYQKDRILAPYDPSVDPKGDSVMWQANQSRLALSSGQLTGTGLYQGTQTQSGAVPAQHTDFIFAVIGEELGLLGCLAVIVLLLAIILRCVVIGLRSKNTMSMLVCFGVGATILFQSFVNIGMCTGMTPVIGLTLPFFSYGGSSMFSLFAAMGLVSGIKFRPKPERFHRY